MVRLVDANLDAEADLARLLASESPHRPRSERQPSRRALEVISAFATLLRAFAADGDALRTPLPVSPARLADVPGLPLPRLVSALSPAAERPRALLAWAETPATAALRRDLPAPPPVGEGPLHEVLWRLPAADPAVVARVHHRTFALAVARELGVALPGAAMVASLAELEARLAARPEVAAWVVKAPLSAAGRDRHVHRGGALDDPARRAVANLFARHGALLFEPWMERTEDFGCAVLLRPDGARIVGVHRQLVDRRGRFLGVELGARFDEGERWGELTAAEEGRLRATVEGVAGALRRAGYVGPFGLDAWRHRRGDGSEAFHPLGEVNARMTFGLVARALVDRLRAPLGLGADARVRLVFGREPAGEARAIVAPAGDAVGVWLQ